MKSVLNCNSKKKILFLYRFFCWFLDFGLGFGTVFSYFYGFSFGLKKNTILSTSNRTMHAICYFGWLRYITSGPFGTLRVISASFGWLRETLCYFRRLRDHSGIFGTSLRVTTWHYGWHRDHSDDFGTIRMASEPFGWLLMVAFKSCVTLLNSVIG